MKKLVGIGLLFCSLVHGAVIHLPDERGKKRRSDHAAQGKAAQRRRTDEVINNKGIDNHLEHEVYTPEDATTHHVLLGYESFDAENARIEKELEGFFSGEQPVPASRFLHAPIDQPAAGRAETSGPRNSVENNGIKNNSLSEKISEAVAVQAPTFKDRADEFPIPKAAGVEDVSFRRWHQACKELLHNIDLSPTGCQPRRSDGSIIDPDLLRQSTKLAFNSAFYLLQNKRNIENLALLKAKKIRQKAWGIFDQTLTACMGLYISMLRETKNWLRKDKNLLRGVYLQKLVIAPGDQVIFFGDRHADIASLMLSLERLQELGLLEKDSFRLKNADTYLIFLGDFVDRGFYGAEVLYTVMRLKCANPNRVFIARGNHESESVSGKMGFLYEVFYKCDDINYSKYHKIIDFFALLPAAIFIECAGKIIQACHGGIHIPYQDVALFKEPSQVMYEQTTFTDINGFMWSDFVVKKDGTGSFENGSRGGVDACCANYEMTHRYLANMNRQLAPCGKNMVGFIRAHQHASSYDDRMMSRLILFRGIYPLWLPDDQRFYESVIAGATSGMYEQTMKDSLVRTLNVSPDSMYGVKCKYAFDSFGILQTAAEYDEWKMRVYWTVDERLLHAMFRQCNENFDEISATPARLGFAGNRLIVPYVDVADEQCKRLLSSLNQKIEKALALEQMKKPL